MLPSAVLTGLGLGSMYGLLALGFYITYAVSSTVNFAQGSSMMLGAVFAYVFAVKIGWPLLPDVLRRRNIGRWNPCFLAAARDTGGRLVARSSAERLFPEDEVWKSHA